MDSWRDRDLYELIGVVQTASTQEIKKAYRKKALSCHPDKNPNNPKAAELFHELSHALEILTDTSARAAYDKVINAKYQAKLRAKEFDAKRRKLMDHLKEREDAYKNSLSTESSTKSDKDKLQAEIERLRKTGSKQVEEEIALMKKKIAEESREYHKKSEIDSDFYIIKVKWKSNKNNFSDNGYNYDTLYQIFSKYGNIIALVCSSTKHGSALVKYQNKNDAEMALNEVGLAQNPLKIQKLWDISKQCNFSKERTAFNVNFNERMSSHSIDNNSEENKVNQKMSDVEFERSVLNNLRKAEEKKRSLGMSHLREDT